MLIDGELEATTVKIRNSIDEVRKVDPYRQPAQLEIFIARRDADEKDFLFRDVN